VGIKKRVELQKHDKKKKKPRPSIFGCTRKGCLKGWDDVVRGVAGREGDLTVSGGGGGGRGGGGGGGGGGPEATKNMDEGRKRRSGRGVGPPGSWGPSSV